MFGGASGAAGVIANLSGAPVDLGLPDALRGLRYGQGWAAPGSLVTGAGSLRGRNGRTAASLRLEPFSLTLVVAGGR
jgi:hypothetical protein